MRDGRDGQNGRSGREGRVFALVADRTRYSRFCKSALFCEGLGLRLPLPIQSIPSIIPSQFSAR
jgi:hypothetical protein